MQAILDFNRQATLKIGDDDLQPVTSGSLPLQALMFLAQNGTKTKVTHTKHTVQTYEISEDTANLLRYMLDAPNASELEEKLEAGNTAEVKALTDMYVEARKDFKLLTSGSIRDIRTKEGRISRSIMMPFNSGRLTLTPVVLSDYYDRIVYLVDVRVQNTHIQYITPVWSPGEMLRLKNNTIKEVVSDIFNDRTIEGYVKINGKDFKLNKQSQANNNAIVIRHDIPVAITKKIQEIPPQYKSDIIAVLKKDVPIEAINALK